jgi:hypothetical protein
VTDGQRGVRRDYAGTSEGDDRREQVVALAPFTAADVERLAGLDRSESVPMLYTVRRGEIVPLGRGEEIPQWGGAWLDGVVAFTRRHLEGGGTGAVAVAGARLADPPDPELFALEPEDVHLVLDL